MVGGGSNETAGANGANGPKLDLRPKDANGPDREVVDSDVSPPTKAPGEADPRDRNNSDVLPSPGASNGRQQNKIVEQCLVEARKAIAEADPPLDLFGYAS